MRKRSLLSKLLSSTWTKVGTWLGVYDAIDPRNTAMRGLVLRDASPADLAASIPQMRALARQFERNNPTARAIADGIAAILVGTGIGLEPDTGDPDLDALIRPIWNDYIQSCGLEGESIYDLQHLAARELPIAGEALWRLQPLPTTAAQRRPPVAVIPIEPEGLDTPSTLVPADTAAGTTLIAGIEVDPLGRPVAYHVHGQRVPASQIAHMFDRRRPGQVRGETWYAPVLTTLRQERDLVTAELQASRNTAAMSVVITARNHQTLGTDEAGDPVTDIPAGSVVRLRENETATPISHTRPAQGIAPFRSMLRGDLAGAMRIGQRWIDRDVSRANYSSLRADMLDQERLMGPLRERFGHRTIGAVYKAILPYLAILIGRPIPSDRYRLIPDGQPYVDPQKDAAAALASINGNLSTYEYEVGKRGQDARAIQAQRQTERTDQAAAEIAMVERIQQLVNEANQRTPGLNLQWAQVVTLSGAGTAPGAYLQAATQNQTVTDEGDASAGTQGTADPTTQDARP